MTLKKVSTKKIKVFVAYHKKMPYFSSAVFQPIFCGEKSCNNSEFLSDNIGINISDENIYYSELTGHYWVLKNYLPTATEEYIGFCHYRRFWNLSQVSNTEYPSAFGIRFKQFKEIFENWKTSDSDYEKLSCFDVILPCRSYFTGSIINPIKPNDNSGHTFNEYFEKFHIKVLQDTMTEILKTDYSDYYESALEVYERDYMYPYNMYIMRKNLISEFLSWMFDVFEKIELKLPNFKQKNYYRQFGFLAEIMVNIWLVTKLKRMSLNIGYCPFYMLDFETDYLEKAVEYKNKGEFGKSIKELLKAAKISGNETKIYNMVSQLYFAEKDIKNALKYSKKSVNKKPTILGYLIQGESYLSMGAEFYNNALLCFEKMHKLDSNDIITLKRLINLCQKTGNTKKLKTYSEKFNNVSSR